MTDTPFEYESIGCDDDVDESQVPGWWRKNIDQFRDHDLPSYRPPRFSDGTVVPIHVDSLEERFGVTVRFQVTNLHENETWTVVIDDESLSEINHARSSDGYTVFDVTADEFEAIVRDAVA